MWVDACGSRQSESDATPLTKVLKAEGSPTTVVAALNHHTFATLLGVKREFGYFCVFDLIQDGADFVPRVESGCV